jgi:hypothetical protein
VAGLHLLRGAHLGWWLVMLVGRVLMLMLVLMLMSMLGMCQVLLHFLQLLLDWLRHGASWGAGTTVS